MEPLTREDYERAIYALEAQITFRRLRDAVLGVEGAVAWIAAKEAEIQTLRDELDTL